MGVEGLQTGRAVVIAHVAAGVQRSAGIFGVSSPLKRHPSGVAFSHGTGIEPKLLRWVDIGSRRRPDAGNLNPQGIVP